MDKIKPENMKNPWKTIQQKNVYENEWMAITECNVIRPDSKRGIYAFMKCRPAVGVIPFDEFGNTWLVGQFRFPIRQYSWEIPTGMGESGESLEATARRELQEETGVSAQTIINLGFFHTSNSLTNEVATIFLALDCTPGGPSFDPTEKIQIEKVPFSRALEMCGNREITDAMSIIGLQWAHAWLKKSSLDFV